MASSVVTSALVASLNDCICTSGDGTEIRVKAEVRADGLHMQTIPQPRADKAKVRGRVPSPKELHFAWQTLSIAIAALESGSPELNNGAVARPAYTDKGFRLEVLAWNEGEGHATRGYTANAKNPADITLPDFGKDPRAFLLETFRAAQALRPSDSVEVSVSADMPSDDAVDGMDEATA